MRIHRRAAGALAGAVAVAAASALGPAVPALAHGAPTTPISRTAACAEGGESTGTAACRAARAANGGNFGNFDNLRIAGVNGRDRQVVPDGHLCSGGLADFRGLDLPRDDFPATKVSAGATLTVRYRATIPHAGEFRIFLTRAGHRPDERLTWDDLGSPLTRVTDPPLSDGAYRMTVRLPAGRTGRHILYVVWETSSTPDTYYSCSDLVFPAAATRQPAAPARTVTRPAATRRATSRPTATKATAPRAAPATPRTGPAVAGRTAPPAQARTPVRQQSQVTLGHWIVAGALLLGLGAAAWAGIGGLRRRRRENR